MDHAAVLNALPKFKSLLIERRDRCGVAWYESRDAGLGKAESGSLAKRARAELGFDLERRADGMGEKIEAMIELLKMSGGEMTADVARLYCERFKVDRISGPIAKAARVRLGLSKWNRSEKSAPSSPPVPAELREALNIVGHVEKIQREANELDHQIDVLQGKRKALLQEIETYKPAMAALRTLSTAVSGVRSKIAADASGVAQ